MIDAGKRSVLGIGVDAIDYEAAVARTMAAATQRQPMTVTALAVHGVMTGVVDPAHRYRLRRLDLVCPDGQPVRWAIDWLYRIKLPDRVYGPELTLRLCAAAEAQRVPVYLFGATEPMLERFAARLSERFPGLQIAGRRASRFRQLTESERDQLAAEINASGAGLCFVGLGCPRQEVFVYEMRERIQMPLVAVGAAFAFHAGMLSQAPAWMQRRGLEWLYRLGSEPRRLWRRYLILNPYFLGLLVLQMAGRFPAAKSVERAPQEELLLG